MQSNFYVRFSRIIGKQTQKCKILHFDGDFRHIALPCQSASVSEILQTQITETEDTTMAKRDKYHPDYKKLYPSEEIAPEVMKVALSSLHPATPVVGS